MGVAVLAGDFNAKLGYAGVPERHVDFSVPVPIAEIVSSKFVPIKTCFWRSPVFVIKSDIYLIGILFHLHSIEPRLVTLPLVTGFVGQCRIADQSGPHP